MKKLLILLPLILLANSCDIPPQVCIKSHSEIYYTVPPSFHIGMGISVPMGDMEQHSREVCDQYGNATSTQ